LLEIGALSVTLQDSADEPVFEPGVGETPLWQATRVLALFEIPFDATPADIDTLTTTLLSELQRHVPLPAWRAEQLEDQSGARLDGRLQADALRPAPVDLPQLGGPA
jgi:ribosomal protein L11 methyltransferase